MPNRVNKFIILESVDSTNNYAMALVQKGDADSGDAVFALDQTAGKGRRGKQWESSKGENIILTVITDMEWLNVLNQFQVSVAIALAGYELISRYTNEEIKIKWPNDLFINDRKAGGILIENVIKGQLWQWSIVGIGININQEQFQDNVAGATSLMQVTGRLYEPIALAKELHLIILDRIIELKNGHYKRMLAEYNQNLFGRYKKVKLKTGPVVFEAEIQEVSPSGELITKNAIEQTFKFDEVEWIF